MPYVDINDTRARSTGYIPMEQVSQDELAHLNTLHDALSRNELQKSWFASGITNEANAVKADAVRALRDGDPNTATLLDAKAQKLYDEAALNAPRVQRLSSVKGVGDFLDWATGSSGNLRSSVKPALAGIAGAGLGTVAAPFTGGIVNPYTGAAAASALAGYGDTHNELVANAANDNTTKATPQEILNKATFYGVPITMLDSVLGAGAGKVVTGASRRALVKSVRETAAEDAKHALLKTGKEFTDADLAAATKTLTGKRIQQMAYDIEAKDAAGGAGKYMAKNAAVGALEEGPTETAQDILGQMAQNELSGRGTTDNLDWQQALDAGAAGALPGALIGGAGGAGSLARHKLGNAGAAVSEVKSDPVGKISNIVADAGSVGGKLAVKGLDAFERMVSSERRAYDTLVSPGGTPEQHGAAAMQWAQHVLEDTASHDDDRVQAGKFVNDVANGDQNAVENYRTALSLKHHETRIADGDTEIASSFVGGSKASNMSPSDRMYLETAAYTPTQAAAAETAADIWRKQGVSEKLLKATSDKTDPAQRKMAIGMMGWIERGFKDLDGNTFVPESLTKRYGDKAPAMIETAARTAFQQGLVGHDVMQQLPEIVKQAQLQHAENTTVRDAVLNAIPEYARSMWTPGNVDELVGHLHQIAKLGATPSQEQALLKVFGTEDNVRAAMSKFETPDSAYGKSFDKFEGTEEAGDTAYSDTAPRVTFEGFSGTAKPFNVVSRKHALDTVLGKYASDPSVQAKAVGAHDALVEQFGGTEYQRQAENELLWNAVSTEGATAADKQQYLSDIEALDENGRAALLKELNKTHRMVRLEHTSSKDMADLIRPDQVESFRETRKPGSPYVTAQFGTLYLERKGVLNQETGEVLGKDENFITTTHKLISFVYEAEAKEAEGKTLGEGSKGAVAKFDAFRRGLAALIQSDGTFTGRVGFMASAKQTAPQWMGKGAQFPANLLLAKVGSTRITVADAIKQQSRKAKSVTEDPRDNWDNELGDEISETTDKDLTPTEHAKEKPIYRNNDGARIGLGDDAIGAGYEGHPTKATRADESIAAPLATVKDEGVGKSNVVEMLRKGIPAAIKAISDYSDTQLIGLRDTLDTMLPITKNNNYWERHEMPSNPAHIAALEKRIAKLAAVVDERTSKYSRIAAKEPRELFAPQWHEGFAKALDAVRAGFERGERGAGKAPVPIGRTPVVLRAVLDDAGKKPFKRSEYLVGQGSTIYLKGLNQHGSSLHNDVVGYSVLRNLPALLANPVAVFKSTAEGLDPNSFKVLIDAKSENGMPVIVALKPEMGMQQLNGERVNLVATVFPVPWDQIRSWNESGHLRYYNEKSPLTVGSEGSIVNSRASKPGSNRLGAADTKVSDTGGVVQKSPLASYSGSNGREAGADESARTREGFSGSIGAAASGVKVVTAGELEALPESAWSTQEAAEAAATPEAVEAARQEILGTVGDTVELQFKPFFKNKASGLWTPRAKTNLIRLALNADVVSAAQHESMHEFVGMLMKNGNSTTVEVLKRVATNPIVNRKLERLLKDHPKAAADVYNDPEEAVAFMYQFWRRGDLRLGPEATTLFEKIKAALQSILQIVSAEARDAAHAEMIMRAFAGGEFKSVDGDTAVREASLKLLNESTERHERALENIGKSWLDFNNIAGKLFFSAEAMMQATKNADMIEIASKFNQESGKAKGADQSMFEGVRQQTGIYMNKLENILGKYSKEDLELARQALSTGKAPTDRVAKEIVQQINAFNDEMFDYIKARKISRWDDDRGEWVRVQKRQNYFTRVWDTTEIQNRAAEFKERLLRLHNKELQAIADNANKEMKAGADMGLAAKTAAENNQTVTPELVADAILIRLLNSNGHVDLQETTSNLGMTPAATSVNRRTLDWLKDTDWDDFKSKDLVGIMSGYVYSMVKRGEYTRVFGNGGERLKFSADKAVLREIGGKKLVAAAEAALPAAEAAWSKAKAQAVKANAAFDTPYPTLRAVGQSLHSSQVGQDQALSDMTQAIKTLDNGFKAIMAMEGTLGNEISAAMRTANSLLMTYQTVRTLPLTLFSSINDVMGIVARGGELSDAWDAFVRGMREIRSTYKGEKTSDGLAQRAELWGTVEASSLIDALGQTQGSMYMGDNARKFSNAFFRWNGMEGWNRAMRIMATSVAERVIRDYKLNGVDMSDKAAVARFEELFGKGFDPKSIKLDAAGDLDITNTANQIAVAHWVTSAIMSPNASHRTIWGSDPRFAALWQLKQFAYTFHRVMLKGAYEQAKLGNLRPAMVLATGYIPVTIAAGAMKEMLIPGDEPPWMKQGLSGYISYGVSRAGIAGVPGMEYEALTSYHGPIEGSLGAMGGPTVSQLLDVTNDSVSKTMLGAMPLGSLLRRAAD